MVILHILECSEWIKGFQSSRTIEGVVPNKYIKLEKVTKVEKRPKVWAFLQTW